MPARKYLLLSSFTLPETAGSGVNAYNFACALNNAGHEAKILSFRRSKNMPKDSLVKRIPYLHKNTLGKILSLPLILCYYIYFILKTEVVFLYGNRIIAWEIVVIVAKIFRKKIIFQSLLPGVDDLETIRSKPLGFIHKRVLSLVDCYYAINPVFTSHWIASGLCGKKVFEHPQGVETDKFAPLACAEQKSKLRTSLYEKSDTFIPISVGFLIERKGYNIVFEALTHLNFDYTYYFLGESDFGHNHFLRSKSYEASKLLLMAKNLLANKIVHTGFVSNVDAYLKSADIFIHGNAKEGLPNVILEAMASGIPVVSSPISGLISGFLVDRHNCLIYHNQEELQKAIIELKTNLELRDKICVAAREFVINRASFSTIIKSLDLFLKG